MSEPNDPHADDQIEEEEVDIPLQSNINVDDVPAPLPSSPTAASADATVDLPFVMPSCSVAIEAKRAWSVRNAVVASNLSACAISALIRAAQENTNEDGNALIEKDEFIGMVQILPEVRSGEAFRPMRDTLERIYKSFQVANRGDLHQLSIAILPLVRGTIKEKVEAAIKLSFIGCGASVKSPVTIPILRTALACLLLAITSVFDVESATPDQLQSTASIVTTCVEETVARLWKFHSLAKDATASYEYQIWPWIEEHAPKAMPWVKLVDQTKWPTTKRLTSPAKPDGVSVPMKWGLPVETQEDGVDASAVNSSSESAPQTTNSTYEDDEKEEDEANEQAGLTFQFSEVDGGVVTIGEAEAVKLFDLLTTSAFTKVHPQTLYMTFVQHTGDGLLEEETFLAAIEELVSMTDKPDLMHNSDFLDCMLDLFRSFMPEKCVKVDAFEIAAGFSLFSWGSKSDKLSSAFHYFDGESKGYLNRQQLWRFLRSVLITLLYLSPPSEAIIQRHRSVAELVDTGEQEIMEMIMNDMDDDEEEYDDEDEDEEYEEENENEERLRTNSELRSGVYTFEDFGFWYNSGGFKGMSWLELLDLRKWIFVSPEFDIDGLDTKPVDPVVASSRYYSANNIRVDVETSDSGGSNDAKKREPFTFHDIIIEDPDEDEDSQPPVSKKAPLHVPFSSSTFTSSAGQRSRSSSIPSTLPAICLKNEIVLEFDLPFDVDDDVITELPLTTLCFDNGDLIQYAELQRITKLNQVELYRLYEVFEPYMGSLSNSCIERSTFNACIKQLLPARIAVEVAGAFGIHTNTRIPPPSVGRGKDAKMVADILTRIFFAFNRGGTGKIDLIEFVSAFTIFCAGSKSEKLAFAYRLFDADHDGCLTRREMWKYLRSFLSILLTLGNGSELSAVAIASVADATAIEIVDSIFKDMNKIYSTRRMPPTNRQERSRRYSLDIPESADIMVMSKNTGRRGRYEHRGSLPDDDSISLGGPALNTPGPGAGSAFVKGGVVSFEEFASWYSQHGYTIIAWIELLDAKKWPEVNSPVAEAILRYLSRQQQAMMNATHRVSSGPDSGSSNDTESSNESGHRRERTSSLETGYPETNMHILPAEMLKTLDRTTMIGAMDAVSGIAHLITSPQNSSTSAKDLSSVALQFKLTTYDNTSLRIRLKDVAIVYTISERMNFSSMACGDLMHLFKKYAHGRSLTKPGFLRAMRELVPRDDLTNEDQEFLSFHLLRIFTLFETESSPDDDDEDGESQIMGSSVDRFQLLAGMSIFCGTTKSAKLGVLFKLFDSQGDSYVSRRHLFDMLKSILIILFAFSSYNATKAHTNDTLTTNSVSTISAAERAAGGVISKLFCEAKCRRSDAISLAEFAAWYAAGGYMDCPWLELLDLSKWPAKEAFAASKREKPLIYAFDMLEEGSILHFTESDISTYLFVLRSTKLAELSVNKIYDALLAFATPSAEEERKLSKAKLNKNGGGQDYSYAAVEEDEGAYLVLTRSNFYECIRSLVPKSDMSEKAQQTSSKILSRVFNVFDRKRCGRVNALELACGMSILGKGSKSQKLSMAFDFITKMRQQRHKTLNNYASMNAGFMGGGGGGIGSVATGGFGFGVGGGVNSIATGGAAFGLSSMRGAMSTTAGLRRSMLQAEANALPHSVLFIYLRSFLLALMALSDGTYRLGLEKIYVEADDFIEEAMGDLMTDVTANGGTNNIATTGGFAGYGSVRSRARVTFEQFGEWYNTGGYQLISWVELLDVSKWQQQQDFQEQTASLNITTAGRVRSKRMPVMGSQRHGNYPASTQTMDVVQPIEHISTKPVVNRKKQVRQSDIVSTSYHLGIKSTDNQKKKQQQPNLQTHIERRESIGEVSLCSDGPIMVFAIADEAAELQFFKEDIARLKQFLHQTQLHSVTSWDLEGSMRGVLKLPKASSATALTTHNQFVHAVQQVCLTRSVASGSQAGYLSDESMDLLHSVLEVFVREPDSSHGYHESGNGDADSDDESSNDLIDYSAAVCGLLVVCEGSMLEKLKCAAWLLQQSLTEHAEEVLLETLRSCLMCFLMSFYGMSSSLSADVVRYSAELGAEEVLRAFESSLSPSESPSSSSGVDEVNSNKPPLEMTKNVSLREFSDWFGESGYHVHPWLELTELRHWPAAINVCSGSGGIVDTGSR